MSSTALSRHLTGPLRRSLDAYACGVFALAVLAGVLFAWTSPSAVLLTGIAAFGAGITLIVVGLRARTWTSPLMLLGIPLTLSLAASMLSITEIFSEWSSPNLAAAIAIVAAPLVGVATAVLATGGRIPVPRPGTQGLPRTQRVVAVCCLMSVVGMIVYAIEFASVGGPPLLSSDVEQARFSIQYGPLHLLTQGLPLAFLIATWARVARPASFTPGQLRALEANMVLPPLVLALVGGRSLVLLPLIGGLVVTARYISPRATRRLLVIVSIAVLLSSSVLFLARAEQNTTLGPFQTVLYDSETGARRAPWDSAYRALGLSLGEPLRVVSELRNADAATPPFSTTLWFAHNFTSRAIDPHTVTAVHAAPWLTSTYAGQVLLDFGLGAAILVGVVLGLIAHLLYCGFAAGRSVATIWVYAYLAGPIFMAFYLNVFLYFLFPVVDVAALTVLSRLLVSSPAERSPASAS